MFEKERERGKKKKVRWFQSGLRAKLMFIVCFK